MATVALIGPDGAGKTTIARRLEQSLPMPVKYLYMGINLDSSNRMAPTSRLIHRVKRKLGITVDRGYLGRSDARPKSRNPLKCLARSIKSFLIVGNRICDEWFRQITAWRYQRRGYVVLFDRHYYLDFYEADVAPSDRPRPLARRLHGFLLRRLYPKPNLVIYLDAPAQVLFARKREGTLELLEERRQAFLRLETELPNYEVVPADRPLDDVIEDVRRRIVDFCGSTEEPLTLSAVQQ